LGHSVEVIGAQPYPVLDTGATLTELASLDLYRPTRRPGVRVPVSPRAGQDVRAVRRGGARADPRQEPISG
ncbi:hypothetical protein, partial [Streptomyces sp. NPDC048551]|uniref:hypothetical protein n=1 Tax=Streptomyces sp. NPDC048551 TaxID=3155758 RepID=UPI00343EF540